MFVIKTLFLFSSIVLSLAQENDATFKGLTPSLGRTPTSTSPNKLMLSRRDLEKRCTGTCAECFGAGYTLCPGSSVICYLPGDPTYGLDSCDGSGSSDGGDDTYTSSATAAAPASTSTGTSGTDDLCYQTGATCVSCFGPGYLQCPDGYHCYDPNDPNYDTCPDDSTGGGSTSSGGSTTTTSCAAEYGDGNIPCGSDGCYNPDDGESCCSGGFYCTSGYTCSSTVGKCSYSGGSLSGGDNLLTTTSDSYSFSTPSATYPGYSFATTADALPTSTGLLSSSATGISSFGDSSGAAALALGREMKFFIAAGVVVGAGVLIL